jgi:hypothetical protein
VTIVGQRGHDGAGPWRLFDRLMSRNMARSTDEGAGKVDQALDGGPHRHLLANEVVRSDAHSIEVVGLVEHAPRDEAE